MNENSKPIFLYAIVKWFLKGEGRKMTRFALQGASYESYSLLSQLFSHFVDNTHTHTQRNTHDFSSQIWNFKLNPRGCPLPTELRAVSWKKINRRWDENKVFKLQKSDSKNFWGNNNFRIVIEKKNCWKGGKEREGNIGTRVFARDLWQIKKYIRRDI